MPVGDLPKIWHSSQFPARVLGMGGTEAGAAGYRRREPIFY